MISYGQSGVVQQTADASETAESTTEESSSADDSTRQTESSTSDDESFSTIADTESPTPTPASGSARLPIDEFEDKTVFDLDVDSNEEDPPVLTTREPIFKGTIEPGVAVTITINSETQINDVLITNSDGTFEIDVAKYEQLLEPGEHTITLSFINPQTGLEEEVIRTFFVEPQATGGIQLAQAPETTTEETQEETQEQPFGTTSPFPIDQSSTQSAGIDDLSATDSASASDSATATDSGRPTMPSTASGIPVSGSVGTTLALIFGGAFFLISGVWSFWVSKNYAVETNGR